MRFFCVLVFLLCVSGTAWAQETPMIIVLENEPLVRDAEITIPEHNRETEMVLFRVYDFALTQASAGDYLADVPFFIDRVGLVVLTVDAEQATYGLILESLMLGEVNTAVFQCSFPDREEVSMLRLSDRIRYCTLVR